MENNNLLTDFEQDQMDTLLDLYDKIDEYLAFLEKNIISVDEEENHDVE